MTFNLLAVEYLSMSHILEELSAYIKRTSTVPAFAKELGCGVSTLYAYLDGTRSISPAMASKIEAATKRKFRKERLIFGDAA